MAPVATTPTGQRLGEQAPELGLEMEWIAAGMPWVISASPGRRNRKVRRGRDTTSRSDACRGIAVIVGEDPPSSRAIRDPR